jgi:FMN-dependent NADH-azoreductase
MKKILNVISSPRGAASNSIQLAQAVIDRLKAAWPGSTVKTVNLVEEHFPHLEESHLASFFTPPEQQTNQHREAMRHSEEAIRDIQEADILIIGAPMYNLTIHSALKAWIDHVVRAGLTFNYSEKGVEGLVKGKKAYLIEASGGVYSDGPAKDLDFVEPYLRSILGFIGLTDITTLRVEGTAIPGIKEQAMEKAIAGIRV